MAAAAIGSKNGAGLRLLMYCGAHRPPGKEWRVEPPSTEPCNKLNLNLRECYAATFVKPTDPQGAALAYRLEPKQNEHASLKGEPNPIKLRLTSTMQL